MYEDDMLLPADDMGSEDWYDVMEDHDAAMWESMVLEEFADEDYSDPYVEYEDWHSQWD